MQLIEVKERNPVLIEKLLQIWESSVRATHLFLSDVEINNIKHYVPQALNGVPVLIVAENDNGSPVGFMGIAEQMQEMLFISNENRGHGTGKQLLQYGIEKYSVSNLPSMNKIPLPKVFMNIWDLKFTKERN